jgi:FkbM family methyltransferase
MIVISSLIVLLSIVIISLIIYKITQSSTKNDFISIPTKTIKHSVYGVIKCFTNDNCVCKNILSGSVWEEDLFKNIFTNYIQNNTSIIDCGAFIGSHTILMKKLNKNNDIFCFEMMPEHYKVLLDNIKLNNLSNIYTFNCAVSDTNGFIDLPNIDYGELNNDGNYGSISLYNDNKSNIGVIKMNLDHILPFIVKPLTFIKMDIEGNEILALHGAKRLLTKYKPIILIELWKNTYRNFIVDPIWIFLQSLGYKLNNISNDDYLLKI